MALRSVAALLLIREKVIRPLLAAASSRTAKREPRVTSLLDARYHAVHNEMRALNQTLGIAA
ncbi:MAG: hypothetical protein GEU90_00735 [Gemmatimonas sp.]|nr:hypothetical protein [Gemmatimonas sp.]